jgi:hypothetical protein
MRWCWQRCWSRGQQVQHEQDQPWSKPSISSMACWEVILDMATATPFPAVAGVGGGAGLGPDAPSLSPFPSASCPPSPPIAGQFFFQAGMTVEEEGQYRSSWWYPASEGQLLDLTMCLLQHLCLAIIAHTLVV